MSCVDQLRGRLQAIADQTLGVKAAIQAHLVTGQSDAMLYHYERLGNLIVEALEEYARDHGPVPVLMDVAGAEWLLSELIK
jgi:hypothetical protein